MAVSGSGPVCQCVQLIALVRGKGDGGHPVRCGKCWDDLCRDKNELVRDNYALREEMKKLREELNDHGHRAGVSC